MIRRPHEPTYWYELLLRKEFAHRARRHIRKKMTDVLITIGATDVRSLTPHVLWALSTNYPRWKKHVVVGAGFRKQNRQQLISLQKKDKTIKLYHNLSAAALIRLMYTADIAISGAGQTLNELACVGLPSIGVIVAENQILNARAWHRKNAIHPIDARTGPSANFASQLIHACRTLDNVSRRKEMSRAGRRLIDGYGSRRIAREIKHTIRSPYDQ
ncbi:MAG: glycosyltransferase [Patescibacteria group bacterium]